MSENNRVISCCRVTPVSRPCAGTPGRGYADQGRGRTGDARGAGLTELVGPLLFFESRSTRSPTLLLIELAAQELEPGLALVDAELGLSDEGGRVWSWSCCAPMCLSDLDGALEDRLLDGDEALSVPDRSVELGVGSLGLR